MDIIQHGHYNKENCLRVIEHNLLIAHGEIDVDQGALIGSKSAIGTTEFKILESSDFIQPSSGLRMQFVSDDAADTQTVRIRYFTESPWERFTEDIVLTGTSTVNTIATNIYRIDDVRVIKGNPMTGTMTIKDTGASTLYGGIDVAETFMTRAIHYVRTGYKSYMNGGIIGCGTNGGIVFRIFQSVQYGSDIVTQGQMSFELADTSISHELTIPMVVTNPDGLRVALGIGVKAVVANQRSTGTLWYYDEPIY